MTMYARIKTLEEVMNNLENDLRSTLEWFTENGMVAKAGNIPFHVSRA